MKKYDNKTIEKLIFRYFNICKFEISKFPSFYISSLKILTPTRPHRFPEALFHRFVIVPKRHVVELQLVESSYCGTGKLPKLYSVEYHSLEWVFSRMSFSRCIG